MTTQSNLPEELGHFLGEIYAGKAQQANLPPRLAPQDNADAYRAQHALLRSRHLEIGGWKIGAKSEDGPIQGAPLPRQGIHAAPATLSRSDFAVFGIEVEIMFRFGRDFLPDAPSLGEAEVLSSIDAVGTSIEIVSSRLADWPDVPKLDQLADLQNHGALVVGEFIDYRADFDFRAPQARLTLNGQDVFSGVGNNPAGEPRRLLPWLVAHCKEQGLALPAGTVITAGSYTGMYFPKGRGTVTGHILGLPAVQFEIA